VAIRAAAHDVIAVTDGDCVLAPDWLQLLLEPIERGVDVSAGFYRPLAGSFLEVCSGAVSLPEPEEVRTGWMPSARSIAFRRGVYEAAGGYPEWLDVGEDMYLNHRLVDAGAQIELAPRAIAYWRVRPTLAQTWRQYRRYAEGDAVARMYPGRHLLRFAAYTMAVAAMVTRHGWLVRLAVLGGAAYAARPLRRAIRRLPEGSPDRARAIVAVPAMMVFIDAAKMWGYLRGLASRQSE
jgi:cellulose synthase/poly-beta-1,6-N-acetylglucosamine synthase-like glycosyltransferase